MNASFTHKLRLPFNSRSFRRPLKFLLFLLGPLSRSSDKLHAVRTPFYSTIPDPTIIMEQGQSFKSNNHLVSTTDEAQRTGKFNLQSLPTEIQLDIIRHLILDHDTIEIGPPKEREFVPRRSLSILRVSKQFSALSSSVLYGDNLFVMSDDSILYHPHSVCVSSVSVLFGWLDNKYIPVQPRRSSPGRTSGTLPAKYRRRLVSDDSPLGIRQTPGHAFPPNARANHAQAPRHHGKPRHDATFL